MVVSKIGKTDILFNNAGIYVARNVENFQRSLDVNVTNLFLASKYTMSYLKETKGNIISTASAGRIFDFPGAIAYGTSKGVVISFTRGMAVDYAEEDVHVNCIFPGTGATGMTQELLEIEEIREGF